MTRPDSEDDALSTGATETDLSSSTFDEGGAG